MSKRNNRIKGIVTTGEVKKSFNIGRTYTKESYDEIVEKRCPNCVGLIEGPGHCHSTKRCSDCWLKARKMGWK